MQTFIRTLILGIASGSVYALASTGLVLTYKTSGVLNFGYGAIALWRFIDGNRPLEVSVAGPLIANDFPTLLAAALEGVGLAQIPEPVAKAALGEHRLRHVLAAFAPTTPGIFLFHSGRREVLPKLRAFIEHAKSLSTTAKGTRIA